MFVPITKFNASKANIFYLLFIAWSNSQYFDSRGWMYPSDMASCLTGLVPYGSLRVLILRYARWHYLVRESERFTVGGQVVLEHTGRYALTARGLARLKGFRGKGLIDEANIKKNVGLFLEQARAAGRLKVVKTAAAG